MDALAFEPQFLDHLAPVWRLLPPSHRGRLFVDAGMVERARRRGVDAEPLDAALVRASARAPSASREPGPTAFVASIGDTKVARRLGYRRFAFIEHGAGQSYAGDRGPGGRNPSYAGGDDREDVGIALVPNEYAAAAWRARYPACRVEVVGCPRLADLPQRDGSPGPTVAVSFHWPAFVAPEAGTAVGHYMRAMPELARAYRVIGHAHPKGDWPARMARLYARWGVEFVPEFDDVCRRADVYACDNSSSMFEFAATGRPVVVLNGPDYRRGVSHGGRFWDWATVGVQVDEPGELAAGVARALTDEDALRRERERVVAMIYPVRDGAALGASRALVDWLGGAAWRAA